MLGRRPLLTEEPRRCGRRHGVPFPESELFDCVDVFPTGPRTAVLVCAEPPEAPRLGRRVALRPLGIDVAPAPSPTK